MTTACVRLVSHFLMLLLIAFCTGCNTSKTIVNGVDERDANEILVLLEKQHINAYKVQEKGQAGPGGVKVMLWDIVVSPDDSERAMNILNENGLPRIRSQSLLDLFSASGLVPSEISEQIRYRVGLADEIANMIRKMDGVVDVDVQLSFPKEDLLNPNAKLPPITASVYVKHTGVLDDPNTHLVSKIKQLVSGAITGLSYDNVTVISDRARFAVTSSTVVPMSVQDNEKLLGFTFAKDSAKRFTWFIVFALLLGVLCLISFGLLAWKIYPVLKKRGGVKQLFHLQPLAEEPEEHKGSEEPKES